MNRLLSCIIIMLITAQIAFCAHPYRIVGLKGKIERADGMQLKRMDEVKPADRLRIEKDGEISLADMETKRVYKMKGTGQEISVAKIIVTAKRSANGIMSSLFAATKENGTKIKPVGAAFRGEGQDSLINAITSRISTDNIAANANRSIIGKKIFADDGTFMFRITNDTDFNLYVNVLRKTQDGWVLCLDTSNCISINPNETIDIEGYSFFEDNSIGEKCEYVVIATATPFDPQALKLHLDQKNVKEKTNATDHIPVYFSTLF